MAELASATTAQACRHVEPGASSRPVDSDAFRTVAAQFATGIVVVTCSTADGGVHGATVNSFTSISLAPPTVMVSLRPGTARNLLTGNQRFGVSILDETQEACSRYFSARHPGGTPPEFLTRARVPTLAHCLAWFECELLRAIDVYDHTLFLAHVVACGQHPGSPLVFFASHYHRSTLSR